MQRRSVTPLLIAPHRGARHGGIDAPLALLRSCAPSLCALWPHDLTSDPSWGASDFAALTGLGAPCGSAYACHATTQRALFLSHVTPPSPSMLPARGQLDSTRMRQCSNGLSNADACSAQLSGWQTVGQRNRSIFPSSAFSVCQRLTEVRSAPVGPAGPWAAEAFFPPDDVAPHHFTPRKVTGHSHPRHHKPHHHHLSPPSFQQETGASPSREQDLLVLTSYNPPSPLLLTPPLSPFPR